MQALAPSPDEFRALAARGHNLIPVWRESLADLETPVSAFLKLDDSPNAFLLESVEQGERLGRYSFLGADPLLTYRRENGENVFEGRDGWLPALLPTADSPPIAALRTLMANFRPAPVDERLPPFFGGAVGYLSYDTVRHLERLPASNPDDLGFPEAVFFVADTVVAFDHAKRKTLLVANALVDGDPDAAYASAVARLDALRERLRRPLPARPATPSGPPPAPPAGHPVDLFPGQADAPRVVSTFEPAAFERAVDRCKEYILAGDAFQIVLSQRFSTRVTRDSFDVYRALRAVNPSPYMFYVKSGETRLAGSSPEILVKVAGGRASVRPIAGTRKRGANAAEDKALELDLLDDAKERAEHVMLVDLGRNDLGRVCRPGTVKVPEGGFMFVERYSHVMHLVTKVEGELRPGLDALDALAAAFPAGTVSGAPKIRAMEIIEELEPTRRGPYAGAAGYLSFHGELDSCIAIRCAAMRGGDVHVQAGAGIVADSDPAKEREETLNKARAPMAAIALAQRGLDA